ncbi:hypothetical protein ACFC14_01755 [Microbacterium sp. NPDC055988]|uniref:hypothetical protein n=1 Tax=Microbacterium sp. NPDC055988 TaxID=3345671 RepID=UPI0035E20BD9
MSINSPPAIFIVGLLTVPVAFMLCVHYVPAPITWPAAIAGVIILGLFTRWLTARQVRKEDARYRAQHEEPIPPGVASEGWCGIPPAGRQGGGGRAIARPQSSWQIAQKCPW